MTFDFTVPVFKNVPVPVFLSITKPSSFVDISFHDNSILDDDTNNATKLDGCKGNATIVFPFILLWQLNKKIENTITKQYICIISN